MRSMNLNVSTTGLSRRVPKLFERQSAPAVFARASSNSRPLCTSIHNSADKDKERRRKSSSKPAAPVLRKITGIGKAAETKLKENGITSVELLKQQLLEKSSGNQDLAEKFLKEVGIRQKNHRESILKELRIITPREPVTVCVEGNIGAGKSSFLNYIRATSDRLNQDMKVVPEPVEQWQRVEKVPGGVDQQHFNLLEKFYEDPSIAYVFQSYVFHTRCFQERKSQDGKLPYRLIERSVFSDRMAFVRAMQREGLMDELHTAAYDNIFHEMVTTWRSLVPQGFIYLQATPDTCLRRMRARSRSEEVGVKKNYLETLHGYHEDWLNKQIQGDASVNNHLDALAQSHQTDAEIFKRASNNGVNGHAHSGANGLPIPFPSGADNFLQNGTLYTSHGSKLLDSANNGVARRTEGISDDHHRILMDPSGRTTLLPMAGSMGADTARTDPIAPPSLIAGDLKWIRANTPEPLINQVLDVPVPVLVLDMDEDFDVERDHYAKRLLSSKVEAFFEWVHRGLPSSRQYEQEGSLLMPSKRLAHA